MAISGVCTGCFYLKSIPVNTGTGTKTVAVCVNKVPDSVPEPSPSVLRKASWAMIEYPDQWTCGEGADAVTGISYSQGMQTPGGGGSGFTTGDGKLTLKSVADVGFVMADDRTIGDAASAATNRANADCFNLFVLLWGFPDADTPVSGGRGASASADWNAHKTITLTRQLGRALAVAGAGSGLTARTLGHFDGSETHTITVGEMPAHAHDVPSVYNDSLDSLQGLVISDVTASYGSPSVLSAFSGSGTAMNIMNPRSYWNVMIKL
jgi:hypothetical protein